VTGGSLLRLVAEALAASRISAMVTGSVAAAYYGVQRATVDVDLVIDPPTAQQLNEFARLIESRDLYVSDDAAREAFATRSMFNVVDATSGWKADLIVRKARPFSTEEFSRRRPAILLGVAIDIATVEDVILAKLEWVKAGASGRQIEDVRELVRLAEATLDRKYLERWIGELKLSEQWRQAV
jgi:hypothetical protein